MKLEIICDSRDSAILVCDEDHNDIAEFFHSGHATVGQSYETALMLARKLVEAASDPVCETCNGDGEIDQRLGGMATSSVVPCPDCAPAAKAPSVSKPDPRGPFFSTQWEREDHERRQRGEPELGPGAVSLSKETP